MFRLLAKARDMAVFAAIYELICKLAHMLLVGLYFGPQEDLGTMGILSAFTKDTDKIARTALDDAPASDAGSYQLRIPSYLAGLFAVAGRQRVAEAMRGVGLATLFFARVDGSRSPVQLRRGPYHAY